MYQRFLEAIVIYMKALKGAEAEIEALPSGFDAPYINKVALYLDGILVGFLVDEDDGGLWMYHDATPAETDADAAARR